MADLGPRRRRDRRRLLAQAFAGRDDVVGGNDQQPVDAGERRLQRGGIVEIGAARLGPFGGEVGELGGVARGGDHPAGFGGEQQLDHPPSEVAARAGDQERCRSHCVFLSI